MSHFDTLNKAELLSARVASAKFLDDTRRQGIILAPLLLPFARLTGKLEVN